jgi:hypothetical protein
MTQHHDPVHPDSPHLSVELVADLEAGVLDEESATHARHHLAHCEHCREISAALGQVSAGLGALPAVTLPPAVAQRLADVLAAAPAPTPGGHLLPPSDTVVPLDAHRRRAGWSTRIVTAAASVAGILLLSAVGISLLSNSSNNDSAAAGADATGGAGTDEGSTTLALDRYVAKRSGRSYDEKGLADQVDTLLVASQTQVASTPPPSPELTPEPSPDPMVTARVSGSPTVFAAALVDPLVLRSCVVDYLLRPDAAPLAADLGTYEGQPAAILVMPSLDNADKAEVFVVDPDCSGPDATLLLYLVVTMPAEARP